MFLLPTSQRFFRTRLISIGTWNYTTTRVFDTVEYASFPSATDRLRGPLSEISDLHPPRQDEDPLRYVERRPPRPYRALGRVRHGHGCSDRRRRAGKRYDGSGGVSRSSRDGYPWGHSFQVAASWIYEIQTANPRSANRSGDSVVLTAE